MECDQDRWDAVRHRDRSWDGRFCYSVRTTGVYCRPGCAARLARRENVAFHASPAAAEAAGFRPCLRCRPQHPATAATIAAAACASIEAAEHAPSLAELAAAAGLSRTHFHRVFKAATGLTPQAYAAATRADRARRALLAGTPVTAAVYDAGYASSSRFYAAAPQALGMTPATYGARGAGARIRFAAGQCALGAIVVAATEAGVCAILLGDAPEPLLADLQTRFAAAELIGADPAFERWMAQVIAFVEAPALGLQLPLDVRGTAFQHRCWQALRQIPPGTTASYADIAARIGAPAATRAVAGACAVNPVAIAIPCHRVVRTDGGLSGYRWGIARKRALLDTEASSPSISAAPPTT